MKGLKIALLGIVLAGSTPTFADVTKPEPKAEDAVKDSSDAAYWQEWYQMYHVLLQERMQNADASFLMFNSRELGIRTTGPYFGVLSPTGEPNVRQDWKDAHYQGVKQAQKAGLDLVFSDPALGDIERVTTFKADGRSIDEDYFRIEVKADDSLERIALRLQPFVNPLFREDCNWQKLYEENRETIGERPDHIDPGQILVFDTRYNLTL